MKEKAIFYYRQGFNCSQCIIKAAESHFGLQISNQCCKMCSAVNNGFGSGLMCSALVAGVLVFGLMFDETVAKKLRLQLLSDFESARKTFDCAYLVKSRGRTGACEDLIGNTAYLIQKIIEAEAE